MTHPARWSRCAVIGTALVLATAAARAEAPKAARWVAADAAIYLEVTQPSQLIDRTTGGSFQELLGAVPAYGRYLKSDNYRKLRGVVDALAGTLDTTPGQGLRDLTGGGVIFAVEGRPGEKPYGFLFVTPRDPDLLTRALPKLVELARKDATSKGNPDPFTQAEYRGITGYGAADGKSAFAVLQDTLVIADRAEGVKLVIDRALDGPKDGGSLADDDGWRARQQEAGPDALAWGLVRLDLLRKLDPKKFAAAQASSRSKFLIGSWVAALDRAPWIAARLSWQEDRLAAVLTFPTPRDGYPDAYKGFVPPQGSGAMPLLSPPGTIASASLWRDLSTVWESRSEIFTPQEVQGLAQLDTFAGQFFGGRDFGSGVLGSLGHDWRLVVAHQDYAAMDPVPDVKAPAFALVVDLKPDDDDFAQRLKVAFQSFVGLANLGAAQTKAPPLEMGSETGDGVTIATTRFLLPKSPPDSEKEPVHYRHNYSPSAAQVGNHFILSSSIGLARDLVKALKAPARTTDETLVMEADGVALARLVELNRTRLVMQNMVEKGHDKDQAEEEIGTLSRILRYLGHARLGVRDNTDTLRLGLDFALGK